MQRDFQQKESNAMHGSKPDKRAAQAPLGNKTQRRVRGAREVRHIPIVISNADKEMMHRIERFILAYDGDNLLHDIDLNFPGATYRAFFLAYGRAQDPTRWLEPQGCA
jgi:hypothetical protein